MPARTIDAADPLLVFVNARGDQLLNLPTIRALADLFQGRLSVAIRRGASDDFFRGLNVRQFLELDLDFSSLDQRFDADDLARRMGTCDLLLSLNPWHAAPIPRLLELLRPKWSIGYHQDFDETIKVDFGKHNIDLGFDLARRLKPALCVEDFAQPPVLDAQAVAWTDALLGQLPLPARFVVLHGETKADKMWPTERFVQVLDHVLEQQPDLWVIDIAYDRMPHDTGRLGERVIPASGLPMRYALAVVARSSAFLGVDSCFLHAADLFRIPGVALFGPTDPHEFGFRFAPGRHVKAATMEEIEVLPVKRSVDELISDSRRR
jgi:ADP-heptose:LPS heptosyltransferase